ncbi:MAG: adenosylmethionine--8-amino-7-oxononanoate transaminase [Actinomycetota bacterium]
MPTDSPPSRYQELLEKNRRYLWNPFTQMGQYLDSEPLIIERGEGVRLYDVGGREYLDGNSSLWLNIHGHGRQELNDAIAGQLSQIAHSTLLGMGNIPAIELAHRLVDIAPKGLEKVFYSDCGAAAVEIGLKMAFSYWRRLGRPEKRRFVSFHNAYHGDTIGAMSAGGIDLFHAEYGLLLLEVDQVPYPDPYRFEGTAQECVAASLGALSKLLAARGGEVACLIIEPVVQAAGGMIVAPAGFLSEVRRLCTEHDVLLLADEVATGFGRTGLMFACEHEAVSPDLMAIGKGLTGGYLPLAATLATDAIYNAFFGDFSEFKAFFHGHSFTGNQLGCAVALASLELFEKDELIARVQECAQLVSELLDPLRSLPHVGDVRQAGLMCGIELVQDRAAKRPFEPAAGTGLKVCLRARELGMITRPLGDIMTFLPPLASSDDDLRAMVSILHRAIGGVG